ncbi:hypothetical protein [Gordonia rubripertincta]|uniref:Uncharacterized protein n=1 Tax=Gordonia rubripertincta TaxID=36822 RepID=A0ABT4MY72_GORRU|nr:hypothetical protein [Gordonia rubripertincta]MCZ4551943.1 hypothetical protein [Gordonia rubripertincta]
MSPLNGGIGTVDGCLSPLGGVIGTVDGGIGTLDGSLSEGAQRPTRGPGGAAAGVLD